MCAIQRNVQTLGSSELPYKTFKMAMNEAVWSNKGMLSESVNVMLRNSDDWTELTHYILEDSEEENLETQKQKGKQKRQKLWYR